MRLCNRQDARGFTLIELLVVLAIIATLLTLAIPRYFSSLQKSKEVVMKENLWVMRDALDKYYGDVGSILIGSQTWPKRSISARFRSTRSRKMPRPGA